MFLTCARETWVSKKAKQKAAQLEQQSVKNICVIKHAALGDLVHTRPMLIALRKEFPSAKITLSVISHYMRGIPEDLIDELHVVKGKGHKTAERFNSLRSLPPQDIIFDITASTNSMWLSLFTTATLKIGYIHKGIERLVYDIAIPRAHYRFEAETFAEQLHVIGLDFDWPLIYNMPDPGACDCIPEGKPYFVYFTTASTDTKIWPESRFTELIQYAMEKYPDVNHVLLAGIAEWEKQVADNIKQSINNDKLLLVQGGDVTESIIDKARLVICCDTGIRNLAIAYQTPTLGIFTPISFTAFAYRPYFGGHMIVSSRNNEHVQVDDVINGLDVLTRKLFNQT